jgi:lipopolysaccharide export system protein LptC
MVSARSLRTLWLRLSAWTPVLLLGLAAAFSWWVAQAVMHAEHGGKAAAPPPQLPDYVLHQFSAARYSADGRLSAVLDGTRMVHDPASGMFQVAAPRWRSVDPAGTVTTASALNGRTNRDGSNVQLLGDAVVERSASPGRPPLTVRSDFLNIFPDRQVVESNRPTVVQQGGSRFTGDSLAFNGVDGTLAMRGQVSGTVVPAAAPQPGAR